MSKVKSRLFSVQMLVTAYSEPDELSEAQVERYIRRALDEWGSRGDARLPLFDGLKACRLAVLAVPERRK